MPTVGVTAQRVAGGEGWSSSTGITPLRASVMAPAWKSTAADRETSRLNAAATTGRPSLDDDGVAVAQPEAAGGPRRRGDVGEPEPDPRLVRHPDDVDVFLFRELGQPAGRREGPQHGAVPGHLVGARRLDLADDVHPDGGRLADPDRHLGLGDDPPQLADQH